MICGGRALARQDRRLREFERRETEILDAALALCATPDFASVTMGQIAERAEVGKGTLYMHFASKDELLFRLMLRFYRGLLAELRTPQAAGSPLARLRAVIAQALHYHEVHREYRYVVQYCDRIEFRERADPAWRADFQSLDRAFGDWGAPLIEAAMAAGVIPCRPVAEVMLGLHACFQGAVMMIWAGADWSPLESAPQAVRAAAIRFMIAGLVGDPDA